MCMAPLARGRMFGRSDLAKMAEDPSLREGIQLAFASKKNPPGSPQVLKEIFLMIYNQQFFKGLFF